MEEAFVWSVSEEQLAEFPEEIQEQPDIEKTSSSSLVEELDKSKEIQIPPKTSQDRLFEDFVEDSVQLVASQDACNLPRRKRRRRIRRRLQGKVDRMAQGICGKDKETGRSSQGSTGDSREHSGCNQSGDKQNKNRKRKARRRKRNSRKTFEDSQGCNSQWRQNTSCPSSTWTTSTTTSDSRYGSGSQVGSFHESAAAIPYPDANLVGIQGFGCGHGSFDTRTESDNQVGQSKWHK